MALVVLDASVVIALLDPGDAQHSPAVAAYRRHVQDDLRIPVSAYSEALVAPSRKGVLTEARRKVRSLLIAVEPISTAAAERAADLRAQRTALRLPDALVLACAESIRANVVLTGDRRWRGVLPSVRLI